MKERKNGLVYELLDLLRMVLICFVVVYVITTFIFKPVKIDGDSMHPTLIDKQYGISFVIPAIQNKFNRFDIAVVNSKESDDKWVKRIIGLPGETVEYKNDKLYINGEYVEEPFFDEEYIKSQTEDHKYKFTNDFGPITLQDNEYFLMGDNRVVSYDSRRVGPFDENDIVSTNIFIIYPFNHFGKVSYQ